MKRIPNDLIPNCYKFSKQAYEGKITIADAREKIHTELGINYGAAKDYYLYYSYLMTGEKPTWLLNSFTLEYFLKNILEDYNNAYEQKHRTLRYFKELITKFEKGKIGSKKSMNAIYEKYIKLLNNA